MTSAPSSQYREVDGFFASAGESVVDCDYLSVRSRERSTVRWGTTRADTLTVEY